MRVPGSVSDPTRFRVLSTCANPPPHLSAAQSKECAPARDYATASALPADPVTPARSAEAARRRHAEATSSALFSQTQDAQASRLQAEWWHGVGRHARQMRGEIVRTRKNLRVRSRSLRVQTGLYRSLYPIAATFLFRLREHTVSV